MYIMIGACRCRFFPFGPEDFCFLSLLSCLFEGVDQLEGLDLMGFLGGTN